MKAENPGGCEVIKPVEVVVAEPPFVAPNVFSPNGDGVNDTWEIKNISSYPGCTVEIFNRYGTGVYFSYGYPVPWDGKYKGADVPVGTYYYVIKTASGSQPVTGFVAIIR